MLTTSAFIGIEISSGRHPFTYAALDENCNLLALASASLDDLLAFAGNFPSARVAVNAPSQLARGGTRKRSAKDIPLAGADGRVAELELRGRGILIPKTPSRADPPSSHIRTGLALYKRLEKMGARAYPDDSASLLWMETNAHACFCALLGQIPMQRRSLEGRIQRQIVLYDAGLQIQEPMDFFEELTRHRMLMGQLPMERVHSPEELDALVAAYTAWVAAKRSDEMIRLGSNEDGYLILPTGELKEKY